MILFENISFRLETPAEIYAKVFSPFFTWVSYMDNHINMKLKWYFNTQRNANDNV
jgi:hypothetical protein